MFKDIIDNRVVNTGRQYEMDLGRALPVFAERAALSDPVSDRLLCNMRRG